MAQWKPEYCTVPPHMRDEQAQIEAQIRSAFKGVSRNGGTSWTEAEVIDGFGTEDQREDARRKDNENNWEELVDDACWEDETTFGGPNFLDCDGIRYYIAPLMVRATRRGHAEWLSYFLERSPDEFVDVLSPQEAATVARFVRFMLSVHETNNDDIDGESWREAYFRHWRKWDNSDSGV